MVSTKFDKKALAEVYEVLIMLDKKDLTKIPKRLVETIKLNKDNEYKVDFQDIEDGKILPDTIKILSTLYTYYLASEEEKNVIFKLINSKKEQHKEVDYPIFKNRIVDIKEQNKEQNMMIVKKDNLLKKILYKIKKFFIK